MTLQARPAKGFSYDADFAAIKELQGLNVSVLTGAAANTDIALAAIRQEDTILSCIEIVATTAAVNDRTGVTSINDVRAVGTLTFGGQVTAGETITVAGIVYTFRAAANPLLNEITIGADANGSAANTAAKIALNDVRLVPSVATNVVTIRARDEGTGPNAFTLAEATANVTVSGATLAGGTVTGSIDVNANTTGNKLIVIWFNKK